GPAAGAPRGVGGAVRALRVQRERPRRAHPGAAPRRARPDDAGAGARGARVHRAAAETLGPVQALALRTALGDAPAHCLNARAKLFSLPKPTSAAICLIGLEVR